MKIITKTVDDNNMLLTVKLGAEEVGKRIDEAYRLLVRKLQIQPKRDSTPKAEVIARMGEEEAQKAVDRIIMDSIMPFAVTKTGLQPGCTPEMFSEDVATPDKEFTFRIKVFKKPQFTLSSYDPVAITIAPIQASKEEVDERMAEVAKSHITVRDDNSHDDVREGDLVILNIDTVQDGKKVDVLCWQQRPYQVGQGYMPKDFDKNLIGIVAGGPSKTFDFEIPGASAEAEDAELKPFTTTVSVEKIRKEVIPSITSAWVEVHIDGCNTLAEYEEQLKQEIIGEKAPEYEQYKNAQCAFELSKRLEGSLPDELYEAAMREQSQMINNQLQQHGMTREDWLQMQGMNEQQLSMNIMMQARTHMAQAFSLDALADHLGLEVEQADIDELFLQMAGGQDFQVPAIKSDYEQSGRMYLINEAARRMKANKWLVDNSNITVLTEEEIEAKQNRSGYAAPAVEASAQEKTASGEGEGLDANGGEGDSV